MTCANRTVRAAVTAAGILVALSQASSQESAWSSVPKIGLGAGMTVCEIRAKSLTDYINMYALPSERVSTWNIAGGFFAQPVMNLTKTLSLKLQYAYLINSHKLTDPLSGTQIEFSYGVHMPSVILEYMYSSREFFLKVGGGAGYVVANLDQKFPDEAAATRSTAHGPGIVFEGSGETPLSESVFLTIGAELRFSFAGSYHGGLFDSIGGGPIAIPTMNFMSAGVSLGALYYF